jgi:hypothetical protein
MNPVIQPTGGCWQSFVNCLSGVWGGMEKAAIWAANFFSALGMGIGMFVRLYARELMIGGIGLAVGITIALICSRCFGCCNKPVEEAKVKNAQDQTMHLRTKK